VVLQAIALAGNVYYLGMMQEAVEDGRGGRDIADQLTPLSSLKKRERLLFCEG